MKTKWTDHGRCPKAGRHIPVTAVALFSLMACTPGPLAPSDDVRTLVVMGEERSYVVHIPDGTTPTGLAFAFHGSNGTGAGLRRGTDLNRMAEHLGVAIVYPDASHANWAEDCGGCTSADRVHLEADTAFVSMLGTMLSDELGLTPDRWFAVGFSQGGLFAQRLACQMADRFRAVAVVAQTMAVTLIPRCRPSAPVGMLDILGLDDSLVPWEGNGTDVSSYAGALATLSAWSALNDCQDPPDATEEGGLMRYRHSGCVGAVGVELIGVEDGRHAWFMSPRIDVAGEIVRFFRTS